MKFRLKSQAGRHHDGATTYKAGDTIVSDADLVKAFPGKFIRTDGKRTAADEEELDEDLPRAAKVGTKLEGDDSKAETGDDPEGTPLAQGPDSPDEERFTEAPKRGRRKRR